MELIAAAWLRRCGIMFGKQHDHLARQRSLS